MILMCVATSCSSTQSGGIWSGDHTDVAGVVLLELSKNHPAAPLIVVDLTPSEVDSIRHATATLRTKLMSRREFLTKNRSWANAPKGSLEFSVRIVEIERTRAVVLAGTPIIGVSGSLDRFTLAKKRGKWIIIRRQSDYQMA